MTGTIGVRTGALGVAASLALLVAGGSAAAEPQPISGELSRPGYEVIALAASGEATSALARPEFRLRPPAKRVSLHLRAADGTYAGPIVVGKEREGKRAIVGVAAGAKLGEVEVKAARGYAKLAGRLPEKSLDADQAARARKGVPIGAGAFGLVRSKLGAGVVPGDPDLDGVPDPLDVDDDGDEVLDNLDLSTAGGGARAARTVGGCGAGGPGSSLEFFCHTVNSGLSPSKFEDVVNVNAGSDLEQINEALSNFGGLRFSPLSDSAELDCGGQQDPDPANPEGWIGGRRYCTRGGTGISAASGPGPPFPGPRFGQFDPDGDGYGTFPKPSFVAHRATTAEIKTGDILTQRVTIDGTETLVETTLNFVFVTGPALVSYSDTAGNCAQVSGTAGDCATVFSYPVAPGGPGTMGNGFPVAGGPCPPDPPASCVDGNVVVTLTFWHPERQAIPNSADPPTAQWMDIGHLTYAPVPAAGVAGGCPQGTFSTADPNLAPPVLPLGGFEDLKGDEESSPGNTFIYKLDLSQCLAANGLSFESGEQNLNFLAVAGGIDTAHQSMWFKHE